MKSLFLSLIVVILIPFSGEAEIIIRPYNGFTLWIDCARRAPVFFMYNLGADLGDYKRSSFKYDPQLPDQCEPTSLNTYQGGSDGPYDRGHMVPINHMDSNHYSAADSDYMINAMPQTKNLNRGAWLETEEIIECARDTSPVLVIGGPIWEEEPRTDFIDSHGVETPDYYWKAFIQGSKVSAWILPNVHDQTIVERSKLNDHRTTMNKIYDKYYIPIQLPEDLLSQESITNWHNPTSCDRS